MFKKFLSSFFFLMLSHFSVHSDEIDLIKYEFSIYSQNGEDGILAQIFDLIKPQSPFCVEFGAYDGITGSNTYFLRAQGWQSVLMDRKVESLEYNVFKEFITAENINQLFDKYQVPTDLDLLSIDVDYNDFYIWKAIDEKYQPAVVLIEYNGTHLPTEDKVVKYQPFFCGGGTNYFGASILAMYNLGRSKGYSLVYADNNGVNLFFVRDELLTENNVKFKNVNDVAKIYRQPKYGNGPNGGHPADNKKRKYFTSVELLK
jgi:hypothetical protein